jgi:hypothetical protein
MTPVEKATNAAIAMSRAIMASCVGRRSLLAGQVQLDTL